MNIKKDIETVRRVAAEFAAAHGLSENAVHSVAFKIAISAPTASEATLAGLILANFRARKILP